MDTAATADDAPRLGASVPRFESADPGPTLDQIRHSPMLAAGQINLIALSAIKARLGPRWDGRREMIHAYAEQCLRRQLGPHGFFLRISETDYLVALPAVGRLAAQVYCLNCLRDILTYFLGEALKADIAVLEVSDIGQGQVSATRLDVGALEAADLAEKRNTAPGVETPAFVASPNRWTPFTSQDGRELRASCQLEPVVQLKTFGPIGYRMRPRVLQLPGDIPLTPAEQRRLTGADIERIDFATLARGLNRLQDQAGAARQPGLILPVSFSTLTSQRGRATLAEFFRAAQANVQRGLICEVADIEGVPPSALLAATSLIRPYCLFVIGRLRGTPVQPLHDLKDAGLQGLALECAAPPLAEADFIAFLRMVTAMTRPATRTLMLFGVGGARQAAIASLFGVTHVSLAPHPAS